MANMNRGSTPASLDSLVRHIIEHPDFKQAVNAASSFGVTPSSSSASSSGSYGIAASSGITSVTATSGVRDNSLIPCHSVNSRTTREDCDRYSIGETQVLPLNLRVGLTGSPAVRGRGRQICSGEDKRSQSSLGGKGKHV